ncbi:protein EXPORTIN 1A [Trifolium repens]|nr:protein EXPORTIN 1A [Trifolium repens]
MLHIAGHAWISMFLQQPIILLMMKKKTIPWEECLELAHKVGSNPQIASLRWIETVADNYPPPLDNYLILKHEWPARWRSFIPDLVSGAKTSEACKLKVQVVLSSGTMAV